MMYFCVVFEVFFFILFKYGWCEHLCVRAGCQCAHAILLEFSLFSFYYRLQKYGYALQNRI